MPALKFGAALICDVIYVDRETGKAVLAGVYSGDLILPAFPAAFPMAFYLEVFPVTSGDLELDVQFHVGRKHTGGAKMIIQETIAGAPSIAMIPAFELQVLKPTSFEVRVVAAGARPVTVIKKRLLAGAPAG